jgi:hypothetical protein
LDASRLKHKQTGFERHVEAALLFHAKARYAHSIYRWMARAQFDRAAQYDARRANEIADFYSAHGEHSTATRFARAQMQNPTCRHDATAWTHLADTYVREADAPGTGAKRQQHCRAKAAQARVQAEALNRPTALVPPTVSTPSVPGPQGPGAP